MPSNYAIGFSYENTQAPKCNVIETMQARTRLKTVNLQPLIMIELSCRDKPLNYKKHKQEKSKNFRILKLRFNPLLRKQWGGIIPEK